MGRSSLDFIQMKNTVFLIDDDKNILTSVSILLETEGFKVKTFSDGESGLKGILENIWANNYFIDFTYTKVIF